MPIHQIKDYDASSALCVRVFCLSFHSSDFSYESRIISISVFLVENNNHHSNSSSSPPPFAEDIIQQVTKSGFTREQAIEELKTTNGDATKALISLMTKSLSLPKRKR